MRGLLICRILIIFGAGVLIALILPPWFVVFLLGAICLALAVMRCKR